MVLSNLVVQLPPSAGPGSKPAWSSMELALLDRFYGSIPNRLLSQKLHRSLKAVEDKARRLGLCKSHDRLRQMGTQNVSKRWNG